MLDLKANLTSINFQNSKAEKVIKKRVISLKKSVGKIIIFWLSIIISRISCKILVNTPIYSFKCCCHLLNSAITEFPIKNLKYFPLLYNLLTENLKTVLKPTIKMITFTQILACNGTALYQTLPKQSRMNFVTSGKLSVLIAYDGMILIQLNEFEYGVNSSSQILYDDEDPQFSYIFYLKKYPEGQWVLKINQNADEVFSCLNEKSYLKNKREPFTKKTVTVIEEQKVVKRMKVNLQEQLKVQKVQKIQKVQRIKSSDGSNSQQGQENQKSILVGASKQLSKGLVFTGKLLSKGLQSFGGFLSKSIKPAKKVQVSQSTKNNIDLAKRTTKNVLTFTGTQVAALFTFGKEVVKDAGQTFEKSQKGQQIQKNQYYGTVKQGVKTGATAIAHLYDGVVNAVYEIGSGASKGATKVVGAKYGKQAEQAADGVFQGVGNVAKIVRVPKDQFSKALKQ